MREGGGEGRRRRRSESDPESKYHRYAATILQEVEEERGRGREADGSNNAFQMGLRKEDMSNSGGDEVINDYQKEGEGGGEGGGGDGRGERRESGSQEEDVVSKATGTELNEECSLATSQEVSEEEAEWYEVDPSLVPSHDSLTKEKKKNKYFVAFSAERGKAERAQNKRIIRHRTHHDDIDFAYSYLLQHPKHQSLQHNSVLVAVKKTGRGGLVVCISPHGKSPTENVYVPFRVELVHPKGDYPPHEILREGERERRMEGEGREGERDRGKGRGADGYYRSEVVPEDIVEKYKNKDMMRVRVHHPQFRS